MRDYVNTISAAEEKGLKKGLEQGRKQGLEQGLEQGREEGREERAIEIARKLKTLGMPSEKIASATGLSISEIIKL